MAFDDRAGSVAWITGTTVNDRLKRKMKKLLSAAFAIGLTCASFAFADQKNDDRIYDQVRMKLTTDPDVKGGIGLDVAVKDGVVTLKGRVDTEKARNRATRLSKKVKGVKDVDNELTVGPPTQ